MKTRAGAVLCAVAVISLVIVLSGRSEATQILLPGSMWEYSFTDPTSDPNWNTVTGSWTTGLAPFGNHIGPYGNDTAGYFSYKTYWAADSSDGDDLWLRIAVNLSGFDLSSLHWNLGVDNGFKLYMNGALVESKNEEGYTWRWEYSGGFVGVPLNPGMNVVAVALEDHGGLTAFDMEITGTAAVPEPSTLFLLASGLVGVGFLAQRRQND